MKRLREGGGASREDKGVEGRNTKQRCTWQFQYVSLMVETLVVYTTRRPPLRLPRSASS